MDVLETRSVRQVSTALLPLVENIPYGCLVVILAALDDQRDIELFNEHIDKIRSVFIDMGGATFFDARGEHRGYFSQRRQKAHMYNRTDVLYTRVDTKDKWLLQNVDFSLHADFTFHVTAGVTGLIVELGKARGMPLLRRDRALLIQR